MHRKRIVLATWGSLGDLHPLIAVGLELRLRGHHVLIAANAYYAEKITALGFDFHPLSPDIGDAESEIIPYLLDMRRGPERLIKKIILPALRAQYDDLLQATAGADLLVASELVYAAPMIAEKSGIRWATVVLAPLSFFSAFDPPVVPNYPWLSRLYRLGPGFVRFIVLFGRALTRTWTGPVTRLRRELGLGRGVHPVFEGKYSPQLVLAMFPPSIGAPQADWPPNTVQTGFAFYDQAESELAPEVAAFFDAGEPPLVFTLGSSAVRDPGSFFHESIAASMKLGRRAILVAGDEPPVETVPSSVLVTAYAPYSTVFSRAAAIVHPGGIGTTAQALRAGRPMIIVPFAFDQPDNAARARRLGVAEIISRKRYRSNAIASTLQRILGDPSYRTRAERIAGDIRAQNGAVTAADSLETLATERKGPVSSRG